MTGAGEQRAFARAIIGLNRYGRLAQGTVELVRRRTHGHVSLEAAWLDGRVNIVVCPVDWFGRPVNTSGCPVRSQNQNDHANLWRVVTQRHSGT